MRDLKQRVEALRQRMQMAGEQDLEELEKQARQLLSEAKNTAHEAEAQALFAELARISRRSSAETVSPQVRGLIRRARIRIEMAGDEDDIDEAIDILTEALAGLPNDPEVIALLQHASRQAPHASQRVRDLFNRYGIDAEVPERAPLGGNRPVTETPAAPSNATPPTRAEAARPSAGNYSQTDDLVSELTESYYAGNYQQTIDIANRILSRDPNNLAALDYRQKSEDNLVRGVVPDHRIPFEARVSYNRANSLVRAGNYDEASKLYRDARDMAERSGILSWKDVEQALLDIQDLALARELINEGDRLMAADNWGEALRKYEGALRVVPNDPQAEERVDLIRKAQQDVDAAAVELSMLGGTLEEQVEQLQKVKSKLARVRQLLPTSQRLAQMQRDADSKLQGVRIQLHEQARAALSRVQNSYSIDDRLSMANDALRLAEFAVSLDPADTSASEMLLEARTVSGDLQRARQTIERASRLIVQNYDAELTQARTMLAGLLAHAQDERYRTIVNDLFTRYLERAEAAVEEGAMVEAKQWIDQMRDDPFRILGRRTDIFRLEATMRGRRNRVRFIIGGIIMLIMLGLAIAALAARPQLEAVFFPSLTPTDTLTPTPTLTYTPSLTPMPSDTATPTLTYTPSLTPTWTATPTWTWTPSPTWTPSWTPTASLTPTHTNTPTQTMTPTETPTSTETPTVTLTPSITPTLEAICRVFSIRSEGIRLREGPSTSTNRLETIPFGQPMDVLQVQPDAFSSRVWLEVRVELAEGQRTGWVRDDTVQALTSCPGLPTNNP
jgi:tetratricopeptide (TPR) repeat protein